MVKAMWQVRDDLARTRDVTTNRIVKDAAIVEAAQAAPASRSALSQLPGFAGRGSQRYLRQFYNAIAGARALGDADLPTVSVQSDEPPPPRVWRDKFPEAAARLTACRETVVALAEQYDLPPENLIAPLAVRRLAWSPPRPVTPEHVAEQLVGAGARNWQVTLCAEPLASALLVASE